VSVERKADTGPGLVEVSLAPEDSWRGSVFISLYRGPFHERKEIRPDAEGRYRLEARLPPGDETGIYLRYGPGQSGYAGSSWITLPASGGTSVSDVSLANGFSGSVPAYVQPLGFLAFALVAVLTLAGLGSLLQVIRAARDGYSSDFSS
jgi:hypothetical protein